MHTKTFAELHRMMLRKPLSLRENRRWQAWLLAHGWSRHGAPHDRHALWSRPGSKDMRLSDVTLREVVPEVLRRLEADGGRIITRGREHGQPSYDYEYFTTTRVSFDRSGGPYMTLRAWMSRKAACESEQAQGARQEG